MQKKIYLMSQKGTSMVVFAVALLLIMGCASITVDLGLIMNEKAKVSCAADAGALAGAQELPDNRENAVAVSKEYLQKNGVDSSTAEITVSDDGNSIAVKTKKMVDYYFARVLGFDKGEVSASATAKTAPISGVSEGARPFAIENQALVFDVQYILKEGGGSGTTGNYGGLALGGNGAAVYLSNIINGYDGSLSVGQYVSTEPVNISGPTGTGINTLIKDCDHVPKCTYDNYQPDCPRIITVVIVDSLDVKGKKEVKIVGFASFFLEGVDGSGKNSIVRGRFIRITGVGETSDTQTDYGLRGIRLVK
jgi:hypothetical protein